MHTVTVVAGGNGTGAVTSTPAGISCPGTCTLSVVEGTSVTLSAAPMGASTFLGWSGGGCSGAGTCSFTANADTTINASFGLDFSVVVTKTGTGTGTVTSSPGGINCGADCSETYAVNTMVTLTPAPATDSTFVRWTGGGCSGNGACTVAVSAAVMVTATFDLKQYPLSAVLTGNGTGTVTSTPGGISCGSDCSEAYTHGTVVTLTASPGAGSMFTSWSGACSGSGTCMVTMTGMASVAATFSLTPYAVSVTKAGNGAGTVTSDLNGINCGADCSEPYLYNTTVVLTAAPTTGSVFAGWGGACSGMGTCSVTVTAMTAVTATFTLTQHTLTVSPAGNGTGTVTSNPAGGILCGADCTEPYNYGSTVVLTATPGAGSSFAGWSGACSGTSTCTVTVTAATSVTASFTLDSYNLTVTLAGTGMGTVTSVPAGISCNPTCVKPFLYNTMVTLTATATAPSLFAGWSGACSGGGTCTVTMTTARFVTATFSPPPNKMFVTSGTFTPTSLGGLSGADDACKAAAMAVSLPGTYKAWLSSSAASADARLGSASGWVRIDGKPFANTKADVGNGKIYFPPRITETGADLLDIAVVTGTTLGGIYSNNGDCAGYTAAGTGSVTGGITAGGSAMFTVYGAQSCSTPAHLYCFGVDNTAVVVPPAPSVSVRRAFMRLWTPGGGIASADTACQSDATAAMLPGTYKALLADINASALSRFNLAGFPWVRVDNVPILPTAVAWQSASFFDTGPNVTANESANFGNYSNWMGASSLTMNGTATSTCNGWTTTAGTAMRGVAGTTNLSQFATSGTSMCTFASATITCLQE
jgi:hypothetical protein